MKKINNSSDLFRLNRRMFLNLLVSSVGVYLTKDVIFPEVASANNDNFQEKYHVFVPYDIARRGGIQTVTLRSGDTCKVTIPARIIENNTISIPKIGLQGNDVTFILHSLYDPDVRIADKIYQEIDKADFIRKDATKSQVKQIYELVEDSEYIEDTISLDLLQYLVASSNLDEQIRQRYEIAHQNCLLNIIEKAIETALAKSKISEDKKKRIRGTYQYVRASEPVPDFSYLEDLEAIIAGSDIPMSIKNIYSIASAKSRAFTVDVIIVKLIQDNQYLSLQNKETYLRTYKEIRAGEKISDQNTLQLLNLFILGSNISYSSKVVYLMAQNIFVEKDAESAKENFGGVKNVANFVTKAGSNIVPIGQGVLNVLGAETATGVAISSLSGAASTTATLVYLGGGSVAAGGLGMLGGLAVVTGGAALIGAAGLLSVALVSQMDGEDYKNLGIATATGTLTGAGAVLIAWTAASMLEIAGTLSGAAAITTIISALGGLSVITGGASLIAFGAGFVVWSFLKGQKHRDGNILHQLESRLYTLTEIPADPELKDFIEFLDKELNQYSHIEGFLIAPNIPIDKLSNAISSYADSLLEADEKILAMKNTGFWNDGKEGIILTNKKLIWKNGWSEPEFIAFYAISEYRKLPQLATDEENTYFYHLAQKIGQNYSDL
ncbi:hypothetical protein [Sphaerospermopsis torques-reginae]|uniref:Uncharacterized protein n=1 Tax=Sphaerospermopsis torques-reginae ITEP-024 TaxID=984208 RepID=A0ABX8X5I8_9CYAN|nr:hypothetical protein [Sphaerospermopsis torques-reginae]QYX33971.1 hypothetical protein K2F26_12095 [Sphaerospermopsis torques-reginae ITEP-024]